jgi:DnaK suppressor protein
VTRRQLQHYRDVLIEQLTAIYRGVHGEIREAMLREIFDPDLPRDEVDQSQRSQLHETGVRLAETDALRAQEIEAALGRIRRGEYGMCVECGQPISPGRLKLVPWASRDVECQERIEAEERARSPSM